MKGKKNERSQIETERVINIQALKDPVFKQNLIKDPHGTLKTMGMKNLPSSLRIRVVEDHPNEWTIVLHNHLPGTEKLSDENLDTIAAAGECMLGCKYYESFGIPPWHM